jgi:hypothetical protein
MRFGYFTFALSDLAVSCVRAVSVTPKTSFSLGLLAPEAGLDLQSAIFRVAD